MSTPLRRRTRRRCRRPRWWARSGTGCCYVFLPPTEELEDFVDLVERIESAAAKVGCPLVIEGYGPPSDPRLQSMSVTPDPGVIEVNVAPTASFAEQRDQLEALYAEARLARLSTEAFDVDGTHGGTGGGNHITLGGITPADSPLLRRPDLMVSLLTYWQRHPALSYLFAGRFIGTTSQAPRVDEGRPDSTYELEIAFAEIARLTAPKAKRGRNMVAPQARSVDRRQGAAAPAHRHHRQHAPRRVLHRQALQPRQCPRQTRSARAARVRDAAALPDGDGAVAAGALAGGVVLGRAAARPADPSRRQPAWPVLCCRTSLFKISPKSPPTCARTESTSTPAGWTPSPSSVSRGSARRSSAASRSNCAGLSSPGTCSARSPPPGARRATSTRR